MIGGALGTFDSKDLETVWSIFEDAESHYRRAQEEITYCDKKQQDLLHEMELVDHTYHEVGKLAKELIDIRRRRRTAKNTLDLLEPLVQWRKEQGNQASLNRLSIVLGKMRKTEEKQKNQVYYRRADDGNGDIIGHSELTGS